MTVVYLSPAGPEVAIGGVRKLYDQSQILERHGIASRVVRLDVREDLTLSPADLLVIPETEGDMLRRVAPGIKKVSLCQNAYYAWTKLGDPRHHPYIDNPDLLGVITVSDDSERVLRFAFPDLPISRIHCSIDPLGRFSVGPYPRPKRLCYFARKRAECSQVVLGMLHARGSLDGWEVVAMDGMTDTEVADTYRTSSIFLSFGRLEGRGDPPLEAILSGCWTIGFLAFGAKEYAWAWAGIAPEDDVCEYVRIAESYLRLPEAPDDGAGLAGCAKSIGEAYSRMREESELCSLMRDFADAAALLQS